MMNDDMPPENRKRRRARSWAERRGDFLDGTPFHFNPSAPVKKTKVISAADFNAENPPKTYSREHAGPVGALPKPLSAFSSDKTEREPYRPARPSRGGGRFGGRRRSSGADGDDSGSASEGGVRRRPGGRFGQRRRADADSGSAAGARETNGDRGEHSFDQNTRRGSTADVDADSLLEGRRPKRKARDKVMDILARRPHSRLEIEQKMAAYYSTEEINGAIQFADENGWMMAPEEMAERLSAELGRRNKGHKYIAQYLKKRGLPQVDTDRDNEVEKALELIASKADRIGRASAKSTERTIAKASQKSERLKAKAAQGASGDRKPFSRSPSSSEFAAKRAAYMERSKVVQKLHATLASRGFDGDTISRAIRIWQDEQKDS